MPLITPNHPNLIYQTKEKIYLSKTFKMTVFKCGIKIKC